MRNSRRQNAATRPSGHEHKWTKVSWERTPSTGAYYSDNWKKANQRSADNRCMRCGCSLSYRNKNGFIDCPMPYEDLVKLEIYHARIRLGFTRNEEAIQIRGQLTEETGECWKT